MSSPKSCRVQNWLLNWSPFWKPGNWNSENHPSVNRLLLQIQSARMRIAELVGRNNQRLMLVLSYLLHGWPVLILKSDQSNFESVTSSTSERWNQNLCEARRGRLTWKKSYHSHDGRKRSSLSVSILAIIKKQAKRKREANEDVSPKRFRSPPKQQIRISKKTVPPVMSN